MVRSSLAALILVASFTPLAISGDKAPPTILRVATRDLPTRFTPAGPLTDVDRMAHDLIFEPLIAVSADADGSPRYRPALAESIPSGQGTHLTFRLRPGAKWSSGEPVTVNDIRHSLTQWRKDSAAPFAWDALLDQPQLGASAGELRLSLRHGLLEPWECFTFPVTPQMFQGRELIPKEDAEFAQRPIGSGPFAVVGPTPGAKGVLFRKNPHHPLAAKSPFDEIHWFAAANSKELDAIDPHLTLGFDAAEAGARPVQTTLTRRVWYVAPNHRHPHLARPELRRFLGLVLERDKIGGTTPRLSVTGLTPRDSWTQAPVPRVPDDLHQPEVARGLVRELVEANKPIALTFKFPADQTAKMSQLIDQWHAAAQTCKLNLKIQPLPLAAADLAEAIAKHDFDLALVSEDHGASPGRLMALFAPGSSNFMGVQDIKLQTEIATLLRTRRFPPLREHMRTIHQIQTQSMPFIPLWQHQSHHTLNRPSPLDPLRPFADMSMLRP